MSSHACHRCHLAPAVRSERYCKNCRKASVAEMEACGYLCDHKKGRTVINEELDRSQLNWHTLGGAVERGTDGDDW